MDYYDILWIVVGLWSLVTIIALRYQTTPPVGDKLLLVEERFIDDTYQYVIYVEDVKSKTKQMVQLCVMDQDILRDHLIRISKEYNIDCGNPQS